MNNQQQPDKGKKKRKNSQQWRVLVAGTIWVLLDFAAGSNELQPATVSSSLLYESS